MALADKISPAPREVRYAGLLTALPGFALVAIGIVLAVTGRSPDLVAEVSYYAVLGIGVLACATGLLLGKTWARSPSLVVALILVGVGWYATGPSDQSGFGVPIMIAGVAVIVLLFRRDSRAWVLGQRPDETEDEAARRGGVSGRAAERERDERGDR
ncbi:glucose dehydrogenase [Prauserella isguenensis]|uniref:Glucose dehydrogenase n=1 Tax=Prauserella isguenensis TaxID=1470180 RepID=A0A839S4N7_9PSEU|nr:glucose dehydrogenase [Prauserella isguenensis]